MGIINSGTLRNINVAKTILSILDFIFTEVDGSSCLHDDWRSTENETGRIENQPDLPPQPRLAPLSEDEVNWIRYYDRSIPLFRIGPGNKLLLFFKWFSERMYGSTDPQLVLLPPEGTYTIIPNIESAAICRLQQNLAYGLTQQLNQYERRRFLARIYTAMYELDCYIRCVVNNIPPNIPFKFIKVIRHYRPPAPHVNEAPFIPILSGGLNPRHIPRTYTQPTPEIQYIPFNAPFHSVVLDNVFALLHEGHCENFGCIENDYVIDMSI